MTKIQFFKAEEGESERASAFMQTVNILQDGLFVSDGMLAIIYKDREDYRTDKATLLSDISREIIQAERNLVKNTNSLKYHTKLLESKMEKHAKLNLEIEDLSKEVEKHEESYDSSVSKRANDIKSRLGELQASYKKKGLDASDKALLEKEAFELNTELKEIESVSNEYEANYQKELKRLKDEISNKNVALVNLAGEIKEEGLMIETIEQTVEENKISMESSLEYYKELDAK